MPNLCFVPIYFAFLQIWCAAGVLLTGGRTPDGGYIVGDSVFYSKPPAESQPPATTGVAKLERELTVSCSLTY